MMDSDQQQDRTSQIVSIVMVIAMVGVMASVGFIVVDTVADEDFKQYMEDSAEWCESHGGELYNSRVIGPHGGLHCEFTNGTSVHMSDVIKRADR